MAYIKKINKEARDAAIIDTYKSVHSVYKTAEITGVSRKTCTKVLKNHGVYDKTTHIHKISKTSPKPIAMLTLNNEYVRSFESLTHAVQYLHEIGKFPNATPSYISMVCHGERATAYGYKWAFLDEAETPIICDCAKQDNRKPVSMYSLSGEYIRSFRSISEAARYINGSVSCISSACAGTTQQAHGYQWRYEQDGDNSLTPIKKYQSAIKPVLMYSTTGEFIRAFDSIISAAIHVHAQGLAKSVHSAESNIKQVLKSKSQTACGYKWKYATPDSER